MRELLTRLVRRTPLEPVAIEFDEQLWKWKGYFTHTYSQHGEDRIILEYFGKKPGTYVDVGANYPIKISNTYLLYRYGWRGLTIEPIPRLSRRHRRMRPADVHVNAAVSRDRGELTFFEMSNSGLSTLELGTVAAPLEGREIKQEYRVPVWPLAELVEKHLPGRTVDLLSIDTEGYDLTVLQSADWSCFRPRLIIHEMNGEQTAEIVDFVRSKGYRPMREIGCNVIMERVG